MPASLPLDGIRVLDLTMVWAGPFGTKLLADMGAEVIKIESPRHMDMIRMASILIFMREGLQEGTKPYNRSAYFQEYNRNKLGLALDLSMERGRELFLDLVARSDVVVENFRPEVLDDLGLGYETLRATKGDIILVSMPAYGKSGRDSGLVGYGPSIEEMSGLAMLNGTDGGPPMKTGISYGDPMAGIMAAAATVTALLYRWRTGQGQYVELSQRDALIGVIGDAVMEWQMNGRPPARTGNRDRSMSPQGCYPSRPWDESERLEIDPTNTNRQEAATDRWVTVSVRTDDEWKTLCDVIGRSEWADDPRFADAAGRRDHADEIDEAISSWTQGRTDYEAFEALQAHGIPAGPVLSLLAVAADRHLRQRGFLQTLPHPEGGDVTVTTPVWRSLYAPAVNRRPAPVFGQDNRYVLGDVLGLSGEEITALERDGVTAGEPVIS